MATKASGRLWPRISPACGSVSTTRMAFSTVLAACTGEWETDWIDTKNTEDTKSQRMIFFVSFVPFVAARQ